MIPNLKKLATHQIATIIADSETDLLVTTVNKAKDELPKVPQPAWFKASIGKRMFGMYAGYPYEEILMSLTADEVKFFTHMLDNYNYNTGLSILNTQSMSASEKNHLSLGYKGVHQKQLVKRVKKFTYLINPEARIHHKLFEDLLKLWQSLP